MSHPSHGRLMPRDVTRQYPRIVRGEGVNIYDDSGKRYLDAIAGIAVVNIGHGRAQVAAVVKTLGIPGHERAHLVHDPSLVRRSRLRLIALPGLVAKSLRLVAALVEQKVDVVEEEAAAVFEGDLPGRTALSEIACLREDPRIPQHAPADEHAADA